MFYFLSSSCCWFSIVHTIRVWKFVEHNSQMASQFICFVRLNEIPKIIDQSVDILSVCVCDVVHVNSEKLKKKKNKIRIWMKMMKNFREREIMKKIEKAIFIVCVQAFYLVLIFILFVDNEYRWKGNELETNSLENAFKLISLLSHHFYHLVVERISKFFFISNLIWNANAQKVTIFEKICIFSWRFYTHARLFIVIIINYHLVSYLIANK